MAVQNQEQKFFEIIKPGTTYEFIGRQKYWIGLSVVLTLITIVMLPLNAFVIKSSRARSKPPRFARRWPSRASPTPT